MVNFFKTNMEPNKKLRIAETILLILLLCGSVFSFLSGTNRVNADPGSVTADGSAEMFIDPEAECDEELSVCEITYSSDADEMIIRTSPETFEELPETMTAYIYRTADGTRLFFDHPDPSVNEVRYEYKQVTAVDSMPIFNLGISLIILSLSLAIVLFFSKVFTTYEKCWFLSIMVLATIFSVLFPEESANGVNGVVIMLLYLLDTFLNILCELLISKQSRYNFLVSLLVEITEIAISLVLMYRFATMVVTLLFWIPIDILSYINWSRHKDDEDEELTAVRRLKGWQEALIILAILVWTVGVGYFLSGLDIRTDFLGNNRTLETAMIYLDACASAVGIANGLFIFFRLREQWIAWYICAALEAVMNILAGQYVLLILKLGYFTNTTYGYIKWTRYIREHKEEAPALF
ncbi:MAG: nicotinamide mononucleotide transporter [Erysipelotrichaceae bacterium]|nr:nicotinamide mononucleotide transporter [Erysipelotrichaceae bacterium]